MPIVDKLKEALKPGRKDSTDEGDLNKLLSSSAKKVLLQKIEFEPATKGFSYQLETLKTKYVILNPKTDGVVQRAAEPTPIKRQGEVTSQREPLVIMISVCAQVLVHAYDGLDLYNLLIELLKLHYILLISYGVYSNTQNA